MNVTCWGCLGLLAGSLLGPSAYGQAAVCPTAYFELGQSTQNHFSFPVTVGNTTRWACGTLGGFRSFYNKYPRQYYRLSDPEFLNLISSGRAVRSPVPFDSLGYFFEFASEQDLKTAAAVAAKGEPFFIAYYFNSCGCLRDDRRTSQAAVVRQLQRWCIVVQQDHETGCLRARYKLTWLETKRK